MNKTVMTTLAVTMTLSVNRLAEQANRVTLYKVLGRGWHERSA